jgi:hypothetical protein
VAIEDDNPIRKNLTILSTAIVVFYLSEGSFKNNEMTLELINFQFGDVEFLRSFVWLMLIWFLFRYLLEIKGGAVGEYLDEANGKCFYLKFRSKIWKYYENKIRQSDSGVKYLSGLRYKADNIPSGERRLFISVDYVKGNPILINNPPVGANYPFQLSGLQLAIHLIPLTICLFFTTPKLATTYPPIILAVFANVLLAYHNFPCYVHFICS